jgi:hypothetical protein
MEYYLNPFVHTSEQPKVADGKLISSVGKQNRSFASFQVANHEVVLGPDPEIQANNYRTTSGLMYLIIYPGLHTLMSVYQFTDAVTVINAFEKKENHEATISQNGTTYTYNGFPTNWRIVSQGLRLLNVSSDLDQNGFIESVSLPLPLNPNDWEWDGSNLRLTKDHILQLETNHGQWQNSISYKQGDMKEFNTLQMRTLVNDSDHEPRPNNKTYNTANLSREIITDFMDHNMMMRVIRIRTRPATNFTVNLYTNYEFQYSYDSKLRDYHTTNPMDVDIVQVASRLNRINPTGTTAATNNLPAINAEGQINDTDLGSTQTGASDASITSQLRDEENISGIVMVNNAVTTTTPPRTHNVNSVTPTPKRRRRS